MNSNLRLAFAIGALGFAAQAAAQVTFYESENFRGRSFTTEDRVNNLQRFGFNDRASSVTVAGTRWEVCDDSGFRGNCRVLRPGRYPSLAALGLNDRVSSARAVDGRGRVDDRRYAPMLPAAHATFYEHEGFAGRTFTSDRQVDNFTNSGFNDLASSVDVVGANFEVCVDAGFQGGCVVLQPGRYPSVAAMGLNDRISSVRMVANTNVGDNRQQDNRGYGRR